MDGKDGQEDSENHDEETRREWLNYESDSWYQFRDFFLRYFVHTFFDVVDAAFWNSPEKQ